MITHPNPSLRNVEMEIEELQAHTQGVLSVLNNFDKIAGSLASLVESQYQVNKEISSVGAQAARAFASRQLGMAFDVMLKAVAMVNISEQELLQIADITRLKNFIEEQQKEEVEEQTTAPSKPTTSKKKLVN